MSNTQKKNWRRKHCKNQGNSHQEEDSSSAAAARAAAAATAATTDMRTQPPSTEGTGNTQPLNWGDIGGVIINLGYFDPILIFGVYFLRAWHRAKALACLELGDCLWGPNEPFEQE